MALERKWMKHSIMGPRLSYTVEDQFFADILHTGIGGAIQYWAEVISSTSGENPAHDRASILVEDGEDEVLYHIDLDVIITGVQRIMQEPPVNKSTSKLIATYSQKWEWLRQSLQERDTIMVDSDVADMVIQYGLFEREIYG
jgi:hypothetical protein